MLLLQLGLPGNSTLRNCTIHINGNAYTPIPFENPQITVSVSTTEAFTAPAASKVVSSPSPSPAGAVRLNSAATKAAELPASPTIVPAAEMLQSPATSKESQAHSAYEEAQRDTLIRLIMYVDRLGKSTPLALQDEEKRLRERMKITAGVHPHQLHLPDQYDFIFGYLIEVVMTRKGL